MHPAAQPSVRVALRFTARRPVRFFCRRAKTRLAASKTLARISNGTPLPLFCLSRPRASSSTPLSRLSLRAFSLKPRGPFGISAPHARRQRSHCEGRRVIVAWHGSCKFSPLFPTAKPKACDELITGPMKKFRFCSRPERGGTYRPRWVSCDVDGQAGIKHRPALASQGPQSCRKLA